MLSGVEGAAVALFATAVVVVAAVVTGGAEAVGGAPDDVDAPDLVPEHPAPINATVTRHTAASWYRRTGCLTPTPVACTRPPRPGRI